MRSMLEQTCFWFATKSILLLPRAMPVFAQFKAEQCRSIELKKPHSELPRYKEAHEPTTNPRHREQVGAQAHAQLVEEIQQFQCVLV